MLERTTELELSYRQHLLGNRLMISANVFYLKADNMIQTQMVDGRPLNVNTGKTENSGIELETKWNINTNFALSGNYSFLHMSVDCDCDSHPADPKLKDMGILASTDPVALDQACLDLVFNHKAQPGDDEKPLIERINRQHGTYITDYAEKIGLGSKKYKIVMVK